MTFTEAAIEVLRREGKPLHFRKIAEIAVRDGLLDHVGKVPEETMADQLAAHCRLPRVERRLMPVEPGTFALTDWELDEDPLGLENLVEPPDEAEPPYRGRERHPVPSREIARGGSRAEGGKARRREEEERRGRRFPPPAEVAYEILAGAGRALSILEIAAQGAERLLMPDAFVRDAGSLSAALAEDNRRRESAGRRPLFQVEGDSVTLIAQPEPGERPAIPVPARPAPPSAPADVRRGALASLRRRMRECDGPTVEHVAVRLLEKLGFRDLKVAKRGREHVIYTGRRRMGLADLRHGVRIVRNGSEASRRDVVDLRRDLGHYGAQLGVVISAGDAARDARGEAAAAGQLPVVLLCGEALAEALSDAGVGCVPVVVPEVDEEFFRAAAEAAEKEDAARRARREERDRREGREGREPREPREREARPERAARPAPTEVSLLAEGEPLEARAERAATSPRVVEVSAELEEEIVGAEQLELVDEDAEGDEGSEGDEEAGEGGSAEGAEAAGEPGEPGEGGVAGERRRRRRRRRRRGGRGRGREGAPAPGTPGSEAASPEAPGQPPEGAPATLAASAEPAAAAEPPTPPREPGAPPVHEALSPAAAEEPPPREQGAPETPSSPPSDAGGDTRGS